MTSVCHVFAHVPHDMFGKHAAWKSASFCILFNEIINNLVFFQNEGIFVQLDELHELDKITYA